MSVVSTPSSTGQLSLCFAPLPMPADGIPAQKVPEQRPTERGVAEGGAPGRDLRAALGDQPGEPVVEVVLTDNRSRILSVRTVPGGLSVRVHRCFACPPEHLIAPLAVLVGGGRGQARRDALALVRAYFAEHATSRPARSVSIQPKGRYFDLASLRDEINRVYFSGALDVAITWGRHAPRRRGRRKTRSIRLGSWDQQRQLVRIHPALDQRHVPRYVVASVVHHEMVHAALPAEVRGSRRLLHGAEFQRREREFRDFERAERWIASNLDRLLRNARQPART